MHKLMCTYIYIYIYVYIIIVSLEMLNWKERSIHFECIRKVIRSSSCIAYDHDTFAEATYQLFSNMDQTRWLCYHIYIPFETSRHYCCVCSLLMHRVLFVLHVERKKEQIDCDEEQMLKRGERLRANNSNWWYNDLLLRNAQLKRAINSFRKYTKS